MRAPLALIVLGAAAGPAAAAALPPPPYAADPQFQAAPQYGAQTGGQNGGQYGGGQYGAPGSYSQPTPVYDRYSGGAAHPVAAPAPQYYAFAPQAAAVALPARTLGWSGKVEAMQQPAAPTPQPQRIAYPAVRTLAPQPSVASQGWRPLYGSASPAPGARPHTIYDAPSAAPPPYPTQQGAPQQAAPQQPGPPQRQASAQNATGPRFYSLHREYGIEPDPIPLPPRFFGPTADLSAPPPDPVLKRVTDASGQTHTQALPTDDQGG